MFDLSVYFDISVLLRRRAVFLESRLPGLDVESLESFDNQNGRISIQDDLEERMRMLPSHRTTYAK